MAFLNVSCSVAVFVVLLTVLFGQAQSRPASGCTWSGRMPGPGGAGRCPDPMSYEKCPVTPSYQALKNTGKLWRCPSYDRNNGGKFYGNCTPGMYEYFQTMHNA